MIGDDKFKYKEVIDHKPNLKTRIDFVNKQGWGYADTEFIYDSKKEMIKVTGYRYKFSE